MDDVELNLCTDLTRTEEGFIADEENITGVIVATRSAINMMVGKKDQFEMSDPDADAKRATLATVHECCSNVPFLTALSAQLRDQFLLRPKSIPSILAPGLTKLKEILPKLRKSNTEIPRVQASTSTSPFGTSLWDGFQTIMRQTQDLLADCRYQTVKIVFGDRTPPKPTRKRNNPAHSPEFWKLVGETTFPLHRDVELVNLDIDLQRLL